MTDFDIDVDGKSYKGNFVSWSTGYKIIVEIDGVPVSFEPDEEKNLRAIVPSEFQNKLSIVTIEKIASELNHALK